MIKPVAGTQIGCGPGSQHGALVRAGGYHGGSRDLRRNSLAGSDVHADRLPRQQQD